MQADVLDIRARAVLPRLIDAFLSVASSETEKKCFEELRAWNFEVRAPLVAPTIFRELWNELNRLTWDDETTEAMGRMARPSSQVVIDLVLNDPDASWFDDRTTPERESLPRIAERAFRSAVANLRRSSGPGERPGDGARPRGTEIRHLARIPDSAGRSRRMAAAMSSTPSTPSGRRPGEWSSSWGRRSGAWGNYPGGQSGDPGSKFYDDRVETGPLASPMSSSSSSRRMSRTLGSSVGR